MLYCLKFLILAGQITYRSEFVNYTLVCRERTTHVILLDLIGVIGIMKIICVGKKKIYEIIDNVLEHNLFSFVRKSILDFEREYITILHGP